MPTSARHSRPPMEYGVTSWPNACTRISDTREGTVIVNTTSSPGCCARASIETTISGARTPGCAPDSAVDRSATSAARVIQAILQGQVPGFRHEVLAEAVVGRFVRAAEAGPAIQTTGSVELALRPKRDRAVTRFAREADALVDQPL